MAYRVEGHSELCADCRAPAPMVCPRCVSPLCPDHMPGHGRRCDVCESEYLSRETKVVHAVVVGLVVAVVSVGLLGAFLTHMARNGIIVGDGARLAPLIPSVAALLFGLVFMCPPAIRRLVRSRFLSERL